jgi:hypothetical protein
MIDTYEASLSALYLYKEYNTRENYERLTGEPCPPFDRNKISKHWRDKNVPSGRRTVVYANVLAVDEQGVPLEFDGHPYFEPLVLTVEDARTVNIPPKVAANETRIPGTVPVPCRDLEGDEELAFTDGPFRIPVVRRPSLKPKNVPTQWTEEDALILRKIAHKLNVEV